MYKGISKFSYKLIEGEVIKIKDDKMYLFDHTLGFVEVFDIWIGDMEENEKWQQ